MPAHRPELARTLTLTLTLILTQIVITLTLALTLTLTLALTLTPTCWAQLAVLHGRILDAPANISAWRQVSAKG